jgi:hypothetical protein
MKSPNPARKPLDNQVEGEALLPRGPRLAFDIKNTSFIPEAWTTAAPTLVNISRLAFQLSRRIT